MRATEMDGSMGGARTKTSPARVVAPAEGARLSFVVVTRSAPATIERCLKSLTEQGSRNEVIVVDDMSTDDTVQCARRAGARIVGTTKSARSTQLNQGFAHSSGEFICFVDGNEVLALGTGQRIIAAFDRQPQVSALIIPEYSLGSSYIARCRSFEQSLSVGDASAETARVFRASAFFKLGGFDTELAYGFEDAELTDRARGSGMQIGRIEGAVYRDETTETIRGAYRDKVRRGTKLWAYLRRRRFRRPTVWHGLGHWRRMLVHPLHMPGLVLLKIVNLAGMIAGATQSTRARLRSTRARLRSNRARLRPTRTEFRSQLHPDRREIRDERRGGAWRTTLAYLVPIAILSVATLHWFAPGAFIAAGDLAPFYRNSTFTEATHLWGYSASGEGSPSPEAPRVFEAAVANTVDVFGGSPETAQRVFFVLAMALAAAGLTFCFRQLIRGSNLVPSLGAVLAVANPAVAANLPDPVFPATLGALGFAAGILLYAASGRHTRIGLLALASLPIAYVASRPAYVVVVIVGALLAVGAAAVLHGRDGLARLFRIVGRAAPLLIALHAWWILPWAFAAFGSNGLVAAETTAPGWTWSQTNASIDRIVTLTAHPAWDVSLPWAARFAEWPLLGLRWLLPVSAVMAPFIATSRSLRKLAAGIVVAGVGLTFLAKGLHPPFADAGRWLYDSVPGLWLWEPGSTSLLLLVVCLAINASIAIYGILARASRWSTSRPSMWAAAAYLVLGICAAGFPVFTGDVAPRESGSLPGAQVRVPASWPQVGEDLEGDIRPGKVLVLPTVGSGEATTSWGYHGVADLVRHLTSRPVIASLPGTSSRSSPRYQATIHELERRLLYQRPAGLERILDSLGVSHVVLRHDFDETDAADPARLDAALKSSDIFDRWRTYGGEATVFTRRRDVPPVQVFSAFAVSSSTSDDATAKLLTTIPTNAAVVDPSVDPASLADAAAANGTTPAPTVELLKTSREHYRARIDPRGHRVVIVALAEASNSGWRLSGVPDSASSYPIRVDGYRQAWLVRTRVPFEARIDYWPGGLLRGIHVLAILAAVLMLVSLGRRRLWPRRHGDHPTPAPEDPSPAASEEPTTYELIGAF